jgi:hypothetical protein
MSNANFFRSRLFRPALACALMLTATAGAAFAQSSPRGLEPLPEIPPPPRLSSVPNAPDDDDGPQITVRQGDNGAKVEEFRTRGGRLYAVRVTPVIGKPYMLVDPDGNSPAPNAAEINGGVHPAQWTLFEF